MIVKMHGNSYIGRNRESQLKYLLKHFRSFHLKWLQQHFDSVKHVNSRIQAIKQKMVNAEKLKQAMLELKQSNNSKKKKNQRKRPGNFNNNSPIARKVQRMIRISSPGSP